MGNPSSSLHRFYLYDNRGRSFREIHHGYICGREEGEAKYEKDGLVSRKHCRFTIKGNEIYVEDVGSTNHTRVNNVPIQSGRKRRLRLNDVIEIGRQRLILTHQNTHPPAHTQDATRRTKGIVALQKEDGSITRYVPDPQYQVRFQKTLLFLKPSDFYQIKKERRKVTRVKRPTAKSAIPQPKVLKKGGPWIAFFALTAMAAFVYFFLNRADLLPLLRNILLTL